jgi:hypothetical protein
VFNGFHLDSPQAVIEQVVSATIGLEQVVCQPGFAIGNADLRQFLSTRHGQLTIFVSRSTEFVSMDGQKLAIDRFCQLNLAEMPSECR